MYSCTGGRARCRLGVGCLACGQMSGVSLRVSPVALSSCVLCSAALVSTHAWRCAGRAIERTLRHDSAGWPFCARVASLAKRPRSRSSGRHAPHTLTRSTPAVQARPACSLHRSLARRPHAHGATRKHDRILRLLIGVSWQHEALAWQLPRLPTAARPAERDAPGLVQDCSVERRCNATRRGEDTAIGPVSERR